jgi:hypothetical protein
MMLGAGQVKPPSRVVTSNLNPDLAFPAGLGILSHSRGVVLRLSQAILFRTVSVICALLLLVPFGYTRTTGTSKSKHASATKSSANTVNRSHKSAKSTRHTKKNRRVSRKSRGQQVIDPDRTREIQAALIREHYLNGEPSGVWDSQTKAALTKFQSDNGWQTKIVPDSRALIKLGLGPSKDGLLNPESAAIGDVHELGAEKSIPGGSEPQK